MASLLSLFSWSVKIATTWHVPRIERTPTTLPGEAEVYQGLKCLTVVMRYRALSRIA